MLSHSYCANEQIVNYTTNFAFSFLLRVSSKVIRAKAKWGNGVIGPNKSCVI